MKKCTDDDSKGKEISKDPVAMKEKPAKPKTSDEPDASTNKAVDSDMDDDDSNSITEEEWRKLQNIEESF